MWQKQYTVIDGKQFQEIHNQSQTVPCFGADIAYFYRKF
jgi:hypothetical protein